MATSWNSRVIVMRPGAVTSPGRALERPTSSPQKDIRRAFESRLRVGSPKRAAAAIGRTGR